jgi:hypothetical protein
MSLLEPRTNSKHTLYAWRKRFELEGPAGLVERPRGSVKGSRLPDLTKRAIVMLKQDNPEWGVQRISDMLGQRPTPRRPRRIPLTGDATTLPPNNRRPRDPATLRRMECDVIGTPSSPQSGAT